jgi:hypothetical protein
MTISSIPISVLHHFQYESGKTGRNCTPFFHSKIGGIVMKKLHKKKTAFILRGSDFFAYGAQNEIDFEITFGLSRYCAICKRKPPMSRLQRIHVTKQEQ